LTSEPIVRPRPAEPADAGATPDGAGTPADVDAVSTGLARVTLDGAPFPIVPHHCFACGELNVEGIGLRLHAETDACWAELSLPDRFEGWQGIAHGGIVCTILDEVMAWSLASRRLWGLTASMTVRFRRPVPIGRPIRAEGRLVERRRRVLSTTARLVDGATGELLAEAEAVYVTARDADRANLERRYGLVPEAT
jgi:acyl-coenzyme A thioesterase PaaI-like protein